MSNKIFKNLLSNKKIILKVLLRLMSCILGLFFGRQDEQLKLMISSHEANLNNEFFFPL